MPHIYHYSSIVVKYSQKSLQDQQVQLLELGHPFPLAPLLLGSQEFIDETSGGSEPHPPPLPTGQ
jgi:hypothetical protein